MTYKFSQMQVPKYAPVCRTCSNAWKCFWRLLGNLLLPALQRVAILMQNLPGALSTTLSKSTILFEFPHETVSGL